MEEREVSRNVGTVKLRIKMGGSTGENAVHEVTLTVDNKKSVAPMEGVEEQQDVESSAEEMQVDSSPEEEEKEQQLFEVAKLQQCLENALVEFMSIDESVFFREPVDPAIAPYYLDIITEPMVFTFFLFFFFCFRFCSQVFLFLFLLLFRTCQQ